MRLASGMADCISCAGIRTETMGEIELNDLRNQSGIAPWRINVATFTILNLFIGIIVSTMQELSTLPEPGIPKKDLAEALARIETDIKGLRHQIENEGNGTP
jgi:hypothetical protein